MPSSTSPRQPAEAQAPPGAQPPLASPMASIPEVLEQDELGEPICGGCGKMIDEESAETGVIQFATRLWHVDCFRCAKCNELVSTDRDDILLLTDGHPICGQCNYNCQICGLPIMEEAIMTGDESYHASCFTCRSCHSPIEELIFAKTSQGIYCMPCHNERVARSRRHAENKRKAAAAKAADEAAAKQQESRRPHEWDRQRSNSQAQPPRPPSIGEKRGSRKSPTSRSPQTHSPVKDAFPPDAGVDGAASPREPGSSDSGGTGSRRGGGQRSSDLESGKATPPTPTTSSETHTMALPGSSRLDRSSQRPGLINGRSERPGTSSPTLREMRSANQPISSRFTRQRSTDSTGLLSLKGSESAPLSLDESATFSREGSARHTRSASAEQSLTPTLDASSAQRARMGEEEREEMTSSPLRSPPLRRPSEPTIRSGVGLGIDPGKANGKPPDRNSITSPPPPRIVEPREPTTDTPSLSDAPSDGDIAAETSQLKRASRMSLGRTKSDGRKSERATKAFSFFDPDFVQLMDAFARFGTEDELVLSLDSGGASDLKPGPDAPAKPELQEDEQEHQRARDADASPRIPEAGDASTGEGEAGRDSITDAASDKTRVPDTSGRFRDDVADDGSPRPFAEEPGSSIDPERESTRLTKLSLRMRKSIKAARGGNVSLDTAFVESVIKDLEQTKEGMRRLQKKYDQMRRASRQAALGFTSARQEWEQEAQARFEAEEEMLTLKRKLVEQSEQLTELANQRRRDEEVERRTNEVRTNIHGMERDLAKLTVERDLTAAEVAELVSMQSGRPRSGLEANTTSLQRNLTTRLDAVKAKYREEINELTVQRDALLIEIEELKQTKDVFMQETRTLNARNDELNSVLAQLNRRIEMAQKGVRVASPGLNGAPNLPNGSLLYPSGVVGGSGERNGVYDKAIPRLPDGSRSADSPAMHRAAAAPRKFKWIKPKLAESARSAATHMLPMGHSPPVPPKSGGQPGGSLAAQQQHHAYQMQHQQHQQQLQQPQQQQPQQQQQSQLPSPQHMQHISSTALQNSSLSSQNDSNNEIVVKEHLFQPFNTLRPVRCVACQKNIWGQSEMRCAKCGQACHSRCLATLPTSCSQPYTRGDEIQEATGPSMFGRALMDQAASEGRDVPLIVEKCIQAVEAMGMDYEGIYRKSGGTSQLRIIQQLFERGQAFNLEDSHRFNDVSAITSVLKNYFRELPEPLLTFDLHERFIEATEIKGDLAKKETAMAALIHQLPRPHFATLRLLVQHLSRVQQSADENRMNARNLGVVFGPTLMRSGDPAKEFAHMGGKALTIEFMIDNAALFDRF